MKNSISAILPCIYLDANKSDFKATYFSSALHWPLFLFPVFFSPILPIEDLEHDATMIDE